MNIAEYNKSLPVLSENMYNAVFEKWCAAQNTEIDIKDETVISSGKLCNYNYTAMAKICGNIEINVIDLSKKDFKIKTINCTFLQ